MDLGLVGAWTSFVRDDVTVYREGGCFFVQSNRDWEWEWEIGSYLFPEYGIEIYLPA